MSIAKEPRLTVKHSDECVLTYMIKRYPREIIVQSVYLCKENVDFMILWYAQILQRKISKYFISLRKV